MNVTHGHTPRGRHSPSYVSWRSMLMRCYQPSMPAYPAYGGRGVVVYEEWRRSFAAFLRDLGARPSRAHSLDRIDGDGHYVPGNVRWATAREQAWNRRNTRFVTARGETLPVQEWARRTGTGHSTILGRLNYGWSPEDAIFRTPDPRKRVRVTPDRIQAIRRAAAAGAHLCDLAAAHGLDPATVSRIVARKSWGRIA